MRPVSTNQDRYMLSWSEVAAIYNYRENENITTEAVKQAGLIAMKKLRLHLEEEGIALEDMVDI